MTSSRGLHLQARLLVTELHQYQCTPNPIEKDKLTTEFETVWKLFAKKQHRYQNINNIVMDIHSLYSREHVIRGPTHRPSPTHMARKKPSMLYPSAQEYVSWVPRGNTFWADGPSWVAKGTTGGSRHSPERPGKESGRKRQITCLCYSIKYTHISGYVVVKYSTIPSDHFVYAPSQWKTTLRL